MELKTYSEFDEFMDMKYNLDEDAKICILRDDGITIETLEGFETDCTGDGVFIYTIFGGDDVNKYARVFTTVDEAKAAVDPSNFDSVYQKQLGALLYDKEKIQEKIDNLKRLTLDNCVRDISDEWFDETK